MKTFRLQESKTTLLKKLLNNGNITEEQFHIADDFFKRHNAFEKEIDWNRGLNITWDDLKKVIYKERNNKSQARKKIRKGLEGFTEGKDYLVLEEGEYEGEPWTVYQPFTWEASRMIASHYVEPIEGYNRTLDAGWCTAYQKDRSYWDSHNKQEAFIYICGETIPTKKVALSISEEDEDASGSRFLYYTDSLNFNIWDFNDSPRNIKDSELREIISNLDELMERAYKNLNSTFGTIDFKYNLETDRYDYDGSVFRVKLRKYLKPNKDGFTINFGKISGNFNCSDFGLTSLEGAPQTVVGNFYCFKNNLTSLEGAPKEVGGDFYCYGNQLTSLKGGSQVVGNSFDCSWNKLTSLEGAPTEVGGNFLCYKNKLTSLEGAPQTVGKSFYCYSNQLTSLKGAPQTVGGGFNCSINQLTSLKGAPRKVGGSFNCSSNPNLHSLDGIGEVEGNIIKDF